MYQSNPVGDELFSYVNTFFVHWVYVPRNLGERSKTTHFLLQFIQQKVALVFVKEKRVHNTQSNYSFLFARKVLFKLLQ